MNQPADDSATTWIRFEFARHVHNYLQDQIRFSDTKAGVTAAIAGVLFGAFRQLALGPLMALPPRSLTAALELLTAALFVIFSALAILNAYRVLRPRLPPSAPRVGPHHRFIERATDFFDRETRPYAGGNLVNWAEIERRSILPDGSTSYARDVQGQTPAQLTAQLSEHSVVLALIAGQKYQHVRLALNDLLLTAAFLVLLMLELGLLP